eukprot:3536629-Pyramimonas_sp.AAC.1
MGEVASGAPGPGPPQRRVRARWAELPGNFADLPGSGMDPGERPRLRRLSHSEATTGLQGPPSRAQRGRP